MSKKNKPTKLNASLARKNALKTFNQLTEKQKSRHLLFGPDPNDEQEWVEWYLEDSKANDVIASKPSRKKPKKKGPVLTSVSKIDKYGSDRQKAYKAYINSSRWKKIREKVLRAYKHKCFRCGDTEQLHVHHHTYKNFCNERYEDLEVLCSECHRITHKEIDRRIG